MTGLAHWTAYRTRTRDKPAFLIDGLVSPGISLVVGQPYSGKSLLALGLIVSLATGAPEYLGRPVHLGPCPVAYLSNDAEFDLELPERLERLGCRDDDPVYVWHAPHPDDTQAWDVLHQDRTRLGVQVMVYDNLSGAVSGPDLDIATNAATHAVRTRLTELAWQGTGVIAISHSMKNGTLPLGSNTIDGWARTRITVGSRRGRSSRTLHVVSNRAPESTLHVILSDTGAYELCLAAEGGTPTSPPAPDGRARRARLGEDDETLRILRQRTSDAEAGRLLLAARLYQGTPDAAAKAAGRARGRLRAASRSASG
jgi:hypothetical protein